MGRRVKPKPDIYNKKFKEDEREKHPGSHMLHTKWAVHHLAVIEECIQKLCLGNLNLMDIQSAMRREKDKLIRENAAYAEAMEILDSIRTVNFYRPGREE